MCVLSECLCVLLVGWISPEQQSDANTHSVIKCEYNKSGDFQVCTSFMVNRDMSWEVMVQGCKMPSSCDILSSLPQTIWSMSHMKSVLDYVDSCSVCEGYNDEKYHCLISSRDGDFKDSSGML